MLSKPRFRSTFAAPTGFVAAVTRVGPRLVAMPCSLVKQNSTADVPSNENRLQPKAA